MVKLCCRSNRSEATDICMRRQILGMCFDKYCSRSATFHQRCRGVTSAVMVGLRSIQCKIRYISSLILIDSKVFFILFTYRCVNRIKWNEFQLILMSTFSLSKSTFRSFLICFLLLQLMKIESERLSRWITEYLNWNLVNCLEESYAHKYTTNTHVIHCGLATSTRQSMSSPLLLATAKQCLEINGSLV